MTRPLTRTGSATIVPLVAAALLVILAGCGGGDDRADRPTPQSSAEASLTDLASVEDFAARFNEKGGLPRLVLLLSPT